MNIIVGTFLLTINRYYTISIIITSRRVKLWIFREYFIFLNFYKLFFSNLVKPSL